MKCLEYPFDSEYLLKKKKSIKKELLDKKENFIDKRIAILGGSTTNEIRVMLELFLLNQGIRPQFYESEYNQYYEEAMFPNDKLVQFKPEIIYIHTSIRNITTYPKVLDSEEEIEDLLKEQIKKFIEIWESLEEKFHCPIIQNNFEYPFYRLLGNREVSDIHGKINYINRLNDKFYLYAREHNNFYINDINYVSSCYGLDNWSDPFYWYMYKYCCNIKAIPSLAFNVSNIIKAIFGKNKKGLVLDLDNTLWGGIIGDDGVDNIIIGNETPMGQVYSEFQLYLKECSKIGILLNINSKNNYDNAIIGLNHPDCVLKEKDFICIKANWESKDINMQQIAKHLGVLPDSLVFIDDNPVEREIVIQQVQGVKAPELDCPEHYIRIIDHSGFFEVVSLSEDDMERNKMYRENEERVQLESKFNNYNDFLKSLQMEAIIEPFESKFYARIAQLTNKSNQFNLTTKRYTQNEIEIISESDNYITLYGKLKDKFGDNGIVSLVIGEIKEKELYLKLWLMSCRVLRRNMEDAMMDALVKKCKEKRIERIFGYYYPTDKNGMVKEFFGSQGFIKIREDKEGNTEWKLSLLGEYIRKNEIIRIINKEDY